MLWGILSKLHQELEEKGISYMVIGGQAVLRYGEPRLTKDVDITIGVSPERADDLLAIVNALGWKTLPEDPLGFVQQTFVMPCADPCSGVRIDLIFSNSAYEREALGRAVLQEGNGGSVRFAAVEDVIIHKMVAGRPRDVEDVRGILAKGAAMDWDYLDRWLGKFEEAMQRPLRAEFASLQNPPG